MPLAEESARCLAARALSHAGVPPDAADDAAQILTLAEMMGITTHGLDRVAVCCARIAAGGIDPGARVLVRSPAPALVQVDGQNGLGPAIAHKALTAAMEAAQTAGVGAAFLRRANHLGALAPYLLLAAEAGFAAIMTSTTAPMIAPAGGRAALVGNNPFGIGIPNPAGVPVILDMALSVAARSRVRAAAKAGTSIPETWATDAAGNPTTDPKAAMAGLMRAIGGDKGASLALMLDLLAGGLSGAAMLGAIPNANEDAGAEQDLGQMIVLIDTKRLLPDAVLAGRMSGAAAQVAATPPIDPATPPRLPGARAMERLARARAEGFDVAPGVLEDLRRLAGD